ncbi:MAG: PilZ domain-containing protein [Polyangiaceae bacterium]
MSAADRRRHPRVNLDVEVGIRTSSNFFTGRTRDISTGGVFVDMPLMPEPGTEVGIHLTLGLRRFTFVGRVVWVLNDAKGASRGFAAEFVDLPVAAERMIKNFVAKRDPIVFDAEIEALPDDHHDPAKKGPPPLPPRATSAV